MSNSPKTGIVVPTRGLVFTETIIGLLDGFAGRDYKIYLSHNLPTPESFNSLIRRAIDDGNDYILITNDDVVLNKRIVDKLFDKCSDIAFCPCYIGDFPGYYEKDGEVTMIGTSAVLVSRKAMCEIGELRTDKTYVKIGGEEQILNKPYKFGGEEVSFSKKALELGYKLEKIDDVARHLRLVELGEHRSNNGLHRIEEA